MRVNIRFKDEHGNMVRLAEAEPPKDLSSILLEVVSSFLIVLIVCFLFGVNVFRIFSGFIGHLQSLLGS